MSSKPSGADSEGAERGPITATLQDLKSSERSIRKQALNEIERRIDDLKIQDNPQSALSLLRNEGLGEALLDTIQNDTAEICREAASLQLRNCLRAFSTESSANSTRSNISDNSSDPNETASYISKFYESFCTVLEERFSFVSSSSSKSKHGGGRACTEPAEEIRLHLLEIAHELLSLLRIHHDPLTEASSPSSILCKSLIRAALVDPYPQLKRTSCNVLQTLTILFPHVIRTHAEPLLKILCGEAPSKDNSESSSDPSSWLLRHRHAKTRCLALDISAAVLGCCESGGGDVRADLLETLVLPGWEHCMYDRSVPVRMSLFQSAARVARSSRHTGTVGSAAVESEKRAISPGILVILLMGLSDESSVECQKEARKQLTSLANGWSGNERGGEDTPLSEMIHAHMNSILDKLLCDIAHWASTKKLRTLQALEVTFSLVRATELIPPEYVKSVVVSLCACIVQEDDVSVRNAASSCAEALGKLPNPSTSILNLLIGGLCGDNHESHAIGGDSLILSTSAQVSSALLLAGSIVRGSSADMDAPVVQKGCFEGEIPSKLIQAISNKSVSHFVRERAVMWALLETCQSIVDFEPFIFDLTLCDAAGESNESQDPKDLIAILWCCLQLLGCPKHFDLFIPTKELLDDLAETFPGVKTGKDLMSFHFRNVLSVMIDQSDSDRTNLLWNNQNHELRAFDALLTNSHGSAIAKHFDIVAPVFENCLCDKESADHAVKLSMMALLESVMSDETCPRELFHPFTSKLMENVVIPNLVWKVGAKASALRKISAATLFSLLRGGATTTRSLYLTAPRLLPILNSNLSDDDASIRQLVCLSLKLLFNLLPGALGEEPVHRLYPELLKCLDDSNDPVRFAACDALASFFKAAPVCHFRGILEYIVEQLLIHMDDPDEMFQRKILEVLIVILDVDVETCGTVKKLARNARVCHRSSQFCDVLLERADSILRQ